MAEHASSSFPDMLGYPVSLMAGCFVLGVLFTIFLLLALEATRKIQAQKHQQKEP